MRKKTLLLAFTVLLLFCFAESAFASITTHNTIKLVYDDGLFRLLSIGTFSNLNRTNNIWYVDGTAYPEYPSPIDTPSGLSALLTNIGGNAYGALQLFAIASIVISASAIIGLVFMIKKGEMEVGPTVYAIVLCMAIVMLVSIAAIIISLLISSLS